MSHISKKKRRQSPEDVVLFHLRRYLNAEEIKFLKGVSPSGAERLAKIPIFEQFRLGLKTTEYREATNRWLKILTTLKNPEQTCWDFFPRWHNEPDVADLTAVLKKKKARIVEAYPKGSLPRLEGKITGLWRSETTKQLGIVIPEVEFFSGKET